MKQPPRIGPAYLLQGMQLLHHPKLRWLVIWPLLINAFLFIGLTWLAIDQFGQLLTWLTSKIPAWLDFITWIFWILFGGFLLLVYGYTFAILGNLLASPFYGPLSERAEQVLTNRIQPSQTSMKVFSAENPRHRCADTDTVICPGAESGGTGDCFSLGRMVAGSAISGLSGRQSSTVIY